MCCRSEKYNISNFKFPSLNSCGLMSNTPVDLPGRHGITYLIILFPAALTCLSNHSPSFSIQRIPYLVEQAVRFSINGRPGDSYVIFVFPFPLIHLTPASLGPVYIDLSGSLVTSSVTFFLNF